MLHLFGLFKEVLELILEGLGNEFELVVLFGEMSGLMLLVLSYGE
jgi:hypothetical protein